MVSGGSVYGFCGEWAFLAGDAGRATAARRGRGLAEEVLAARRVRSARRFVGWAQPLAQKLDRARGTQGYQEDLDGLREEAEQLEALLGKKGRA